MTIQRPIEPQRHRGHKGKAKEKGDSSLRRGDAGEGKTLRQTKGAFRSSLCTLCLCGEKRLFNLNYGGTEDKGRGCREPRAPSEKKTSGPSLLRVRSFRLAPWATRKWSTNTHGFCGIGLIGPRRLTHLRKIVRGIHIAVAIPATGQVPREFPSFFKTRMPLCDADCHHQHHSQPEQCNKLLHTLYLLAVSWFISPGCFPGERPASGIQDTRGTAQGKGNEAPSARAEGQGQLSITAPGRGRTEGKTQVSPFTGFSGCIPADRHASGLRGSKKSEN